MAFSATMKFFVISVALQLPSIRSVFWDWSPILRNETPVKESADSTISSPRTTKPMIIPLRRETVPVKRKGKVVSFKTSYSGMISVGSPAQMFRVVFDTGSGHMVLPAVECGSESCLVHKRYDKRLSSSAVAINQDGNEANSGMIDRVTISYGTGTIKGEFVRESVCLSHAIDGDASLADADRTWEHRPCISLQTVMAIEMSTLPFKHFGFDGIMGMGLSALALNPEFSFFEQLTRSGTLDLPHFGVFLSDDEPSEIAIGGHNNERMMTSLQYTPVAKPDLGYWQVEVVAVRVGGKTMDMCRDAPCYAVMDTGTSHLGIPTPYDKQVVDMLTTPAGDMLDCRLADLPELQIELRGVNLTIYPDTYMRRLPLREDVNMSLNATRGLELPSQSAQAAGGSDAAATAAPGTTANSADDTPGAPGSVKRFCRPRLMPVSMPAPLGPNLFILGEPVLHRYYTVFDWATPSIGFAISNSEVNRMDRTQITDRIGSLPKDVDVYLMQKSVNTTTEAAGTDTCSAKADEDSETDGFVALQLVFHMNARVP
mmetsp:Transcript_6498/g.12003  ORF Transcript_6498/g.12003 Transcript_6498/m.12003 type:complete len:542 (-) Transcript_6498:183-1808(-)